MVQSSEMLQRERHGELESKLFHASHGLFTLVQEKKTNLLCGHPWTLCRFLKTKVGSGHMTQALDLICMLFLAMSSFFS